MRRHRSGRHDLLPAHGSFRRGVLVLFVGCDAMDPMFSNGTRTAYSNDRTRNTIAARGLAAGLRLGTFTGWCPTAPPLAGVPTVCSPPELQQGAVVPKSRGASSSCSFLWVPEAAGVVAYVKIRPSGACGRKLLFSPSSLYCCCCSIARAS
jgi:hypothetical protein